MTLLAVVSYATNDYSILYGLMSPPRGAQTLTYTDNSAGPLTASSVSYKGVYGFGTGATNNSTGTSVSQTGTCPPGGMLVYTATANATAGGQAFSAFNQTQRSNIACVASVNEALLVGDASGSGSITMSATYPASTQWGSCIVPLLPNYYGNL